MEEEAGLPKGAFVLLPNQSRPVPSLDLDPRSPLHLAPLTLTLSLPRPHAPTHATATIAKLAKDILARAPPATAASSADAPAPAPAPPRLTPDGVAAVTACASEFVRLLAGEAAEAASRAGKNTIVVRYG
jgi:hypothetical protein